MIETMNIPVIRSRYMRYLFCDKCHCRLTIHTAYVVSCLPFDIKSSTKSSATFCRKCCKEVFELDNDKIECII